MKYFHIFLDFFSVLKLHLFKLKRIFAASNNDNYYKHFKIGYKMNNKETGIVVTITSGVKRTKLKAKYNFNTYDDYLKAIRDMLNFFDCSTGRLNIEDTQLLLDDNIDITFKTLKQPKIFR